MDLVWISSRRAFFYMESDGSFRGLTLLWMDIDDSNGYLIQVCLNASQFHRPIMCGQLCI